MIIGVPCISRPDLLIRFAESIDEPCTLLLVDNSPDGSVGLELAWHGTPAGVDLVCLWFPHNLGVAASWNLTVKWAPSEPYWIIANADTVLAPGDLARIRAEMARGGARWVGMNGDWRVFGITRECVDEVGLFDENFHPVYCEDADYERRCSLLAVPWYHVRGGAEHGGSATIDDPRYGAANARTYPSNVAHYAAKWGSGVRQPNGLSSPFGEGGDVRDWTLDTRRLRENAW